MTIKSVNFVKVALVAGVTAGANYFYSDEMQGILSPIKQTGLTVLGMLGDGMKNHSSNATIAFGFFASVFLGYKVAVLVRKTNECCKKKRLLDTKTVKLNEKICSAPRKGVEESIEAKVSQTNLLDPSDKSPTTIEELQAKLEAKPAASFVEMGVKWRKEIFANCEKKGESIVDLETLFPVGDYAGFLKSLHEKEIADKVATLGGNLDNNPAVTRALTKGNYCAVVAACRSETDFESRSKWIQSRMVEASHVPLIYEYALVSFLLSDENSQADILKRIVLPMMHIAYYRMMQDAYVLCSGNPNQDILGTVKYIHYLYIFQIVNAFKGDPKEFFGMLNSIGNWKNAFQRQLEYTIRREPMELPPHRWLAYSQIKEGSLILDKDIIRPLVDNYKLRGEYLSKAGVAILEKSGSFYFATTLQKQN